MLIGAVQHVNLFAEAEAAQVEREAGNKEYAEEKRQEEMEINKKMCIGLGTSNPQQGRDGDVCCLSYHPSVVENSLAKRVGNGREGFDSGGVVVLGEPQSMVDPNRWETRCRGAA